LACFATVNSAAFPLFCNMLLLRPVTSAGALAVIFHPAFLPFDVQWLICLLACIY
jgi:hypothetical protein